MTIRDDELKASLENYDPDEGPGAFAVILLGLAQASADDIEQQENMEFGAMLMTILELMTTGSTTTAGHKAVRAMLRYLKARMIASLDGE